MTASYSVLPKSQNVSVNTVNAHLKSPVPCDARPGGRAH